MKHLTKIVLSLAATIAAFWAMAATIDLGSTGAGFTYATWNPACSVASGITTAPTTGSCALQPLEQKIKIYKVAVCTSKPSAPDELVAMSLPAFAAGAGCSTMFESIAGQEVDFSGSSSLTGSVNPAIGTYKYLYVELDPQLTTKGYVQLDENLIAGIIVTGVGSGYPGASAIVTISGGACSAGGSPVTPSAQAAVVSGQITRVSMDNSAPVVCATRPTVTIAPSSGGTQATAEIVYGGMAISSSSTSTSHFYESTLRDKYLTTGKYCWTSGESSDIIYDWRGSFTNPFAQPSFMQCGDTLAAQASMGTNTSRFNGLNNGANFAATNAPASNGVANGTNATSDSMDFFFIKSDGKLPSGGSASSANDITKVIGLIAIGGGAAGAGITYSGSGTPTLSFNNSRGAKLENAWSVYPGLIYRLGPSSLDGTFTVE